jgi:hypothetical protein
MAYTPRYTLESTKYALSQEWCYVAFNFALPRLAKSFLDKPNYRLYLDNKS